MREYPGMAPTDTAREKPGVPRVMAPFVWGIAVVWLALRGAGHGIAWVIDKYVELTFAAGQALLRAGKAFLRALGPLGRGLVRLLTPLWDVLRKVWDWLGFRLFLYLIRPLGKYARWVLAQVQPALEGVTAWAKRLAARAEPVLRVLRNWSRAVARAAARVRRWWGRAWAPVTRGARRVARETRRIARGFL
jgi:hypothetical protein